MIKEKALLIFASFDRFKISTKGKPAYQATSNENIEELKNLAFSAGAEVEDVLYSRHDKPDPKYFIGRAGSIELPSSQINGKRGGTVKIGRRYRYKRSR